MRRLYENTNYCMQSVCCLKYSKTCLKWPLKKKTKIGFQAGLLLNAGQKYCRMLQESILQHFRPSLSYHLSLRPLFCLILSGPLRQVLLYMEAQIQPFSSCPLDSFTCILALSLMNLHARLHPLCMIIY